MNVLFSLIFMLSAILITFLFSSIYTVVVDSNLENTLWLGGNLLAIFCCIWTFSLVYKKKYGKSMFQKTISDLKHKVKKKVDSQGIIYVKSERRIKKNYFEIYLSFLAFFILIINVFTEGLRINGLYITAGILCIIGFIPRLFHQRKEISADLKSYAQSYLFAGIVYSKRWYQLPEIKKVAIVNASFVEITSKQNISRSTNRVVQYRLFFKFYDTKEILTLLYTKNVDVLKEERDRLHEKINN